MARRVPTLLAGLVLAASVGSVGVAPAALAAVSYANCTALQQTYAHGVGKATATDKVRGTAKPVTTWKKDTKAYQKAVAARPDLDRDRDGVACEKK